MFDKKLLFSLVLMMEACHLKPSESPAPEVKETSLFVENSKRQMELPRMSGEELYDAECALCHGPLADSQKKEEI